MLFGEMCGVSTPSGRVRSIPHHATCFVLQHLDGVGDIIRATTHGAKGLKTLTEHGTQANLGIDARSKELASGYMGVEATLVYLDKILTAELHFTQASPMYKVSMLSLAALADEVEGKNKRGEPKRVLKSMRFSVLLAIIYSAWDATIGANERAVERAHTTHEAVDHARLQRMKDATSKGARVVQRGESITQN